MESFAVSHHRSCGIGVNSKNDRGALRTRAQLWPRLRSIWGVIVCRQKRHEGRSQKKSLSTQLHELSIMRFAPNKSVLTHPLWPSRQLLNQAPSSADRKRRPVVVQTPQRKLRQGFGACSTSSASLFRSCELHGALRRPLLAGYSAMSTFPTEILQHPASLKACLKRCAQLRTCLRRWLYSC